MESKAGDQGLIELQHRTTVPQALIDFNVSHPHATPNDFDTKTFQTIKKSVRKCLNEDQGGLCVYCESRLLPDKGQIDHIKSKKHYPLLAFTYTNLAHSCINDKTCGQKKKQGLLPIEPGLGCNDQFILSTDGEISPLPRLSSKHRHPVDQTLKMLGLDAKQSPWLVAERKKWIDATLAIMLQSPELVPNFLSDKPFRFILRRLF